MFDSIGPSESTWDHAESSKEMDCQSSDAAPDLDRHSLFEITRGFAESFPNGPARILTASTSPYASCCVLTGLDAVTTPRPRTASIARMFVPVRRCADTSAWKTLKLIG